MPFLRERLDADAREYAERTATRIRRKENTGFAGLLDALDELATGVTADCGGR
ncbi:hypothetical protein ACFOEZ_01090 [Tianweitania populi]|uniref:Uncharacterized protein n=1 Tax=Tianweitania populi TaxID=1607949 RepID=A0A8J3DM46_9HYPH|nr:hypothetical protein [Tianweitania populi]GHD04998.1 hypothetical protein GCM10016234_00310 [Tianweitania populi]